MQTLFIVNPNAAGGRARREWQRVEPVVQTLVPDYQVIMTQKPADIQQCLVQAHKQNIQRIISLGGDGTNNAMVNAIMQHKTQYPQHDIIYGAVPTGTGQDWARGNGISRDTVTALKHILAATPRMVDVGYVETDTTTSYFLNISSGGISYDVANRVDKSLKRRPWTFLQAIIMGILQYEPETVRIELDGELWYEGKIYIVTVANGKSFAQGMQVAPDADIADGLFDVVVAVAMPKWELLQALPLVYLGKHTNHPKVRIGRASHVRVISETQTPIAMDLDGEPASGSHHIEFSILTAAIQMLL